MLEWLGQSEQARHLYSESLEIRRRLAAGEPDRADYQRAVEATLEKLQMLDEHAGPA